MEDILKRIETIQRHILNVQENCNVLGRKLIEQGKIDMGLALIANGQIHDNSKLYGVELKYLWPEIKESNPDKFSLALESHRTNNPHHIEYWPNGIKEMPEIYIAELVCDVAARSAEMGEDTRDYFKDKFAKQYKIKTSGKIYKKIKEYLDLLLEKPFK